MKQSVLIMILCVCLTAPSFTAFGQPLEEKNTPTEEAVKPELNSDAAILMDATTGEILYEKNSKNKMFPASITKVMTVLLALENGNLNDTLTFSHDAVYSIEPGSAHIAMQEGEQITLEQALYGILLRSANEVSNAVAEYVDGSTTAFAEHMTKRAKELGCESTNFINANGLFDENHYTTAYDMAHIAKELLKQDVYKTMMSTTYYEIPPTNLQSEIRYLHGQHQMLNPNSIYYYEYATGGKTGYTSEALNTLVTFAKKGDTQLIAVVFKCNGAEHYVDTKALFEYGFTNFQTAKVLSAAEFAKTVDVVEIYKKKTSSLGKITVAPQEDVYQTIAVSKSLSDIQVDVNLPETVYAPVTAGQEVGTLAVKANHEVLATVPLFAQASVAETPAETRSLQEKEAKIKILKMGGLIFLGILLVFTILFCIGRIARHLKRKKRRKKRAAMRRRNHRNYSRSPR